MKKELTYQQSKEIYYFDDKGNKKIIDREKKETYPNGLSGDISGLYGNISELSGNISGLSGNCTNISGDLDECELTEDDRKKGVDIRELIKE